MQDLDATAWQFFGGGEGSNIFVGCTSSHMQIDSLENNIAEILMPLLWMLDICPLFQCWRQCSGLSWKE